MKGDELRETLNEFLSEYGMGIERDDQGCLSYTNQEVVCDFCGSQPTVARFEATPKRVHDLTEAVLPSLSTGAWLACEPCRMLVQAHDRDGLLERAVTVLRSMVPDMSVQIVRTQVRATHAAFWSGHVEAN